MNDNNTNNNFDDGFFNKQPEPSLIFEPSFEEENNKVDTTAQNRIDKFELNTTIRSWSSKKDSWFLTGST